MYDFSKFDNLGPFWFIENESEENQAEYWKIVEEHKEKGYNEVMKYIFEYMQKTLIFETPTNLRHRTIKLKKVLKEYQKEYNSIAVVTHYNIVRFILAKKFNINDEPFRSTIKNCEILKSSVDGF